MGFSCSSIYDFGSGQQTPWSECLYKPPWHIFPWQAHIWDEHSISYKTAMWPVKSQISLCIHTVWSLFTGHSVGSQGSNVSSGTQHRPWSACAYAQADLSLCWVHMQSCKKCCTPAHVMYLFSEVRNISIVYITPDTRIPGKKKFLKIPNFSKKFCVIGTHQTSSEAISMSTRHIYFHG